MDRQDFFREIMWSHVFKVIQWFQVLCLIDLYMFKKRICLLENRVRNKRVCLFFILKNDVNIITADLFQTQIISSAPIFKIYW